jgi:predicted Zn-dependent peptidase
MRIIAFIEDEEVIKKILKHLGLWKAKDRPPPKVKTPFPTIYLDDLESQILSPDSFYVHPDYPRDSYLS